MDKDKWDLFDIFDAREDNFTNMLYFLYDTDKKFQSAFLKLIFHKDVEEEIYFKTRTAYFRQCWKKKNKIIPDIILHSENYFAIIEVKIFSGEGANQTQQYYDARKEIMNKLSVNGNCEQRYYFLTVNETTEPQCSNFQKLCWRKVSECMNSDSCENEMAKLLMSQFKDRVNSMKANKVNLYGKWAEEVHSYLWSGSARFYAALKNLFDDLEKKDYFIKHNIKWRGDHWSGFNKSSNSYDHTAQFLPENTGFNRSWQGSELEEAFKNDDVSSCYDIHFEFMWNEAENRLTLRLDYHLNPYMSQSRIKNMKKEKKVFALKCNEERAKKARQKKKEWKIIASEFYDDYNKHITPGIMTLATKEYPGLKEETVEYVLNERIRPFIEAGTRFITEYFLTDDKNS